MGAKSFQLCPTLCNPTGCSPPGSPVHGILQARILEWVAMPSSRGFFDPRVKPTSPALAGRFFCFCFCFFTTRATWKGPRTDSTQCSSVAQSCPTLCDPMNCSTPSLPVHDQLLEFTQTHVHQFGDAIQPSHPLSSPSPPAPNPSQHPSLFQ